MELPKGFHKEVIEARENARKKVSTYLLNRGGPNYETHFLDKTRTNNLCFKTSSRLGFETVILFGIPLAYITFIIYMYSTKGSFKFLLNSSIFYLVFAYFSLTLIASVFGNLKYYTFSKVTNYYYKGFPLFPYQLAYKKCALNGILAIQVLGEELIEVKSKAKRNSFELNLVLKDLKRIHVIDHNNL
ncbi:hypothetical protein [Winogradskyella sp. PG-2]|uniref:hypothetical protein n=1 Tax=Winogradskyella sp. PG-2 TaxID=754409 RepID=UPI0004587AFD|nr:hypothetical protein [Winogradskyella sp. PG-2]BAO77215.1 hypothetical protein WPG_2985 [Winogradskyella sp. PG-2]